MSNVFAQIVRRSSDGKFTISDGTGAPVNPVAFQGLLLTQNGQVYASTDAPEYVSNGLPFTGDGRVCIEPDPIAYYSCGLPFTARGTIAADLIPTVRVEQGLGFTANGAVSITLAPPPPLLDDFNQTDFLAGDFK